MKRLIACLTAIISMETINAGLTESIVNLNPQTKASQELFSAVEAGSLKKVKKALKNKNLDINALNKNKETALDLATKKELTKIAGRLINYGAKVTSEYNANQLRRLLNSRAHKFFWTGLFLQPYLFIGAVPAWINSANVKVL